MTTATFIPATERQVAFLRKLVSERNAEGDSPEAVTVATIARVLDGEVGPLSRKGASRLIDTILAIRPTTAAPRVTRNECDDDGLDLRAIPSGRYAVPGGDTRLKVRIDVVTEGKWAGWVFVKDAAEYGQGRKYGSQRPGQTYRGEIEAALRVIAADPREASAAYGRLVGACGVCGRHLEDAESVARGIGPICAGKF